MTEEMDSYELVILRRAPGFVFDEKAREENRKDHGVYTVTQETAGRMALKGRIYEPPADSKDPMLHGLLFYRTGSLEETRRLAERDPGVLAGRFVIDVMRFVCSSGGIARSGTRITAENMPGWK
jgi:hypothetical protein